jgi:hypothetical protein
MNAAPTHRIDRILELRQHEVAATVMSDPIEDAIARYTLLHDPHVPGDVSYAVELYFSDYKRVVMDAFLVCGATAEDIFNVLRIPINTSRVYARYFFDVSQFQDTLDKQNYVESRIGSLAADAFERVVLSSAMNNGKQYLFSKFGKDAYVVPLSVALRDMFGSLFCKHAELKSAGALHEGSKEQRAFVRALIQTASAIPSAAEFENADDAGISVKIKKNLRDVRSQRAAARPDSFDSPASDEVDASSDDMEIIH